jgi:general secretion pathway protein E
MHAQTLPSNTDEPLPSAGEGQAALESTLVDRLVEDGRVAEADLARTRRLAEEHGEPVHWLLLRLGLVSERDLAQAMAGLLKLPLAEARDYPAIPALDQDISLRFMKDLHLVPIRQEEGRLLVALADPLDPYPVRAIGLATGLVVDLMVGLPGDIDSAIERLYGEGRSAMKGIVDGLGGGEGADEDDIEHLKDLASEAPVIRLVNLLIQRAVDARASDIHIEPFEGQLKVRYRIDGVLQEVEAPPARSTAAVISRVKIMAKLNIAERRLPQDGRIPLRVQGKELDLRVATVPTLYGESVVMRLLDKASVRFDFEALGFDGTPRDRLLEVLERPHGIILVTGPTGSGKSTTLYTALSRINTPESKIITVEDPVEYQLAGINQIQVKPQIGMTFAGALRAIVRQDPDIIMVGEMRDLETARIAVQSALTGHLVLSTLHTNNAAGGVSRLLDMGVEDYLLTSTVNGIVGQRLVRRLCLSCRESYVPLPEVARELFPDEAASGRDLRLYRARGCEACGGTGYLGRLVIAEVLLMSDALRHAVLSHATTTEIQRLAQREGMATMYQDGVRKALAGLTSLEDVIRVTQND